MNGDHDGPQAIFAVRVSVGDRAPGRGQLRLCFLDRDARREAAEQIELWSLPRAYFSASSAKRDPELMVDRESEIRPA